MNDRLIDNWNSVVRENDIVYHLGDFVMNKRYIHLVNELNGTIYFVPGNHDKDLVKWLKNENIGTKNNLSSAITKVKDNGYNIVLCHYPIRNWEGMENGSYHLYGHVHDNVVNYNPNAKCVCVENIDYTPKTFEQLFLNIEISKYDGYHGMVVSD
jgi:calcineurin-like phosphoesterase family protein